MDGDQKIQALLGDVYDRWKIHPERSLGLTIDELMFMLGIQTGTEDEEALAFHGWPPALKTTVTLRASTRWKGR